MSSPALTSQQREQYDRDGYTLLEGLFTHEQCDAVIEHYMAIHAGKVRYDAMPVRADANDWRRWINPHLWGDEVALNLLIEPRLRQPLKECLGEEPDGAQTMYFYEGSQQGYHQDQYYLPGCMAVWIALVDVSDDNGTLGVKPGSHKLDFVGPEHVGAPHGQDSAYWPAYANASAELAKRCDIPEKPIIASKGDVVLFHGRLLHCGRPIRKPGMKRHVMANHYIARSETRWVLDWPRIDFDGHKRFTGTAKAT